MEENLLAQTNLPLGNISGIGNIGLQTGGDPISLFARILSTMIGLITVIAVIYFLFNLIIGAVSIITSGGDKGAYEDAKRRLTHGFIGLVVTIAAIFIMDLAATLLGIPTILNIQEMIDSIAP